MKLCRDCKHCEPAVTNFLWFKDIDYKYAKCKAPHAINLVDGSGGSFCRIERQKYLHLQEICNVEGKYWEAKQ
jgi:hypothetical protein